MGRSMKRGDLWLAEIGGKPRLVVVLTRDAVLDVRTNVTVAEVTTQARGLAVEVAIGPETGIDQPSVVNCDAIHTISRRRLTRHVGGLDQRDLDAVCAAVSIAVGCERT